MLSIDDLVAKTVIGEVFVLSIRILGYRWSALDHDLITLFSLNDTQKDIA